MMGSTSEHSVLVTGFGPFGPHKVNASWEAVKKLRDTGIFLSDGTKVSADYREIPVVYKAVSELIPKLWKEVKPTLCIHVGVSFYDCVKIEQIGRNTGYVLPDNDGCCPGDRKCVQNGPHQLSTRVNLKSCISKIMSKQSDVHITDSGDAGRYLCDFIYYTSLYHGDAPVIFVHVPPLDQPYSVDQLAMALKLIIETILCSWDECIVCKETPV